MKIHSVRSQQLTQKGPAFVKSFDRGLGKGANGTVLLSFD